MLCPGGREYTSCFKPNNSREEIRVDEMIAQPPGKCNCYVDEPSMEMKTHPRFAPRGRHGIRFQYSHLFGSCTQYVENSYLWRIDFTRNMKWCSRKLGIRYTESCSTDFYVLPYLDFFVHEFWIKIKTISFLNRWGLRTNLSENLPVGTSKSKVNIETVGNPAKR